MKANLETNTKAMVCTMDVLKPDWDRFREKDGRGFNLLPSLRYIH